MWIHTQHSFISVVADRHNPGQLLVRARAEQDLVYLVGHRVAIDYSPDRDYPFRCSLPKETLSWLLELEIGRIDYHNFKSRVEESLSFARARPLHRVWDTLIEIEEIEHPGMRNGPYGNWFENLPLRDDEDSPLLPFPGDDDEEGEDIGIWTSDDLEDLSPDVIGE